MDKLGESKQEKGISLAEDSFSDEMVKTFVDYPITGTTMASESMSLVKQKGLMKPPGLPRRAQPQSIVDPSANSDRLTNYSRQIRQILMDLLEMQEKLAPQLAGDTSLETLMISIKQSISKCLSIVSSSERSDTGSRMAPAKLGPSQVASSEHSKVGSPMRPDVLMSLGPSQVASSENSKAGSPILRDVLMSLGPIQVSSSEHSKVGSPMLPDVLMPLGLTQVSSSDHSKVGSPVLPDVLMSLGPSQVSSSEHTNVGSPMSLNLNLEGGPSQLSLWEEGSIACPEEEIHLEVEAQRVEKKSFSNGISCGIEASRYCAALFPPDYEFERDTLLQLWISQGFFNEEPMEKAAALYFEEIVAMGRFVLSKTNSVSAKAMYKVSASFLHLYPNIVSTDSISNLNDVSPQVSHLSMRCNSFMDFTVLSQMKRFKQLKTLILLQGRQLRTSLVPRDFFLSMPLLQTLDLSRTRLTELPSSIGNLTALHYLNLSETPIKQLPETIDRLECLQTLKLRGCANLSTLPEGMRNLVNLRHLDLDVLRQLRTMPHGMGSLTNLRTLSAFIVDEDEECSIRQLKYLNNLSGSFCVSKLENVLTDEEATEACLLLKPALTKLELRWSDSQDEDDVAHLKVLCCLRPTSGIEELRIRGYSGLELPSWISDTAFYQLHSITLSKCANCLVLPSLGQLPSLRFLIITEFHKLKAINSNLCGGFDIQGLIAFPVLEKLIIENMDSLEEWEEIRDGDFPCIQKLSIKHCSKLHSLCNLSSLCTLQFLEISRCEMLASFPYDKLPASVKEFAIEDCPLITRYLKDGDKNLPKGANIWVDHQEI